LITTKYFSLLNSHLKKINIVIHVMKYQEITNEDTICAIATAVGGAVAIIRLSGPESVTISDKLWHNKKTLAQTPPRYLTLGKFALDSNHVFDEQCLAVRMPAPHSYTGEDTVEFQCHGGALNIRLGLEALLDHGARLAEPGEFTRRAFLNGKMDLTQAEAVSDIISAGSQAALSLANHQLSGKLRECIETFYHEIQINLSNIEARMDFPEEELDFMSANDEAEQLHQTALKLQDLADSSSEGEILRDGVTLAIAGPPNVGKSSILNAILKQDRAIVSDIPGTTRDTIEAHATIRGIPIQLIDTAGIRSSSDLIEKTGIARATQCVQNADIALWITDASLSKEQQPEPPAIKRAGKLLHVQNKSDLLPANSILSGIPSSTILPHGLDLLFDAIEQAVWEGHHEHESEIAVSSRHAALLKQAIASLLEAIPWVQQEEWELGAIPVRTALENLGKITGKTFSPDLLGDIFSRFCIGK